MNISIFLDEVLPINGPLMFIPKSHKHGTLAAGHDTSTTSYPLWTLDQQTVTRLCQEAAGPGGIGIVAPTGKAGSVLMFHGNLVHASPPNITPYPRKIVYVTFCACSNHITKFTRAEWIAAPIAAVVFSAAHYVGALGDQFTLASFTFRALAGLWFTLVYRFRGFAVAVYTHTLYDLFVFFAG